MLPQQRHHLLSQPSPSLLQPPSKSPAFSSRRPRSLRRRKCLRSHQQFSSPVTPFGHSRRRSPLQFDDQSRPLATTVEDIRCSSMASRALLPSRLDIELQRTSSTGVTKGRDWSSNCNGLLRRECPKGVTGLENSWVMSVPCQRM